MIYVLEVKPYIHNNEDPYEKIISLSTGIVLTETLKSLKIDFMP